VGEIPDQLILFGFDVLIILFRQNRERGLFGQGSYLA
jgi:hypothetical protein